MAAETNGISAVGVLVVIELPFYHEVGNEKAAIVVRVSNHLRFAHYCYFLDKPAAGFFMILSDFLPRKRYCAKLTREL